MNQPKLLSTDEASKILGISTRTVKTYAGRGRLQAQKIAGAWKFTEESLTRFLKGEKPRDSLGALVPGLARELRELRDYLIQIRVKPEAIQDVDDILRDYIQPMETITGQSQ